MNKKIGSRTRKKQYQKKYKREFPYRWFLYCREPLEDIEGWDKMINDTYNTTWHLHHRDEIQGDIIVSRDELKANGEYYNLTVDKLIFLTDFEHMSLHKTGDKHPMFGRNGDKHPMFGKPSPNRKAIEIDGVPYGSIEDAVKKPGRARRTICKWLKNGRAKYL